MRGGSNSGKILWIIWWPIRGDHRNMRYRTWNEKLVETATEVNKRRGVKARTYDAV